MSWILATAVGWAQTGHSPTGHLAEDVLVTARGIAVVNGNGQLSLHRSENGSSIWISASRGLPLLALDQGLLCGKRSGSSLQLLLLDWQDGNSLSDYPLLPLPRWLDEPIGRSQVEFLVEKIGKGFQVAWRATRSYSLGRQPQPGEMEAAAREESGSAAFQIETEQWTSASPIPSLSPPEGLKSEPYLHQNSWVSHPFRTSDGWGVFRKTDSGWLVSNQNHHGEIVETHLEQAGSNSQPHASASRDYLLLRKTKNDSAVLVYALGNEEPLAELDLPRGLIAIQRPNAYFIASEQLPGVQRPGAPPRQKRVLRAIGLKTGKPVWQLALTPATQHLPPP